MTTEVPRVFQKGLSKIRGTVDDSGYAFTCLNLEDKDINDISPIKNFIHLQYINLKRNSIKTIDEIYSLERLIAIDLSYNPLIKTPTFPNPNLQFLNISFCDLQSIASIQGESIKSLYIEGNNIETLNEISNLKNLKSLFASNNKITTFDDLIDKTLKIRHLELNLNPINSLSSISTVFPQLQNLSLVATKIEDITELEKLKDMKTLISLNLTETPLSNSENYRFNVIHLLKQLKELDGIKILEIERSEVEKGENIN